LQNIHIEFDVNKAWGTIRESIKMYAKESLDYYEVEIAIAKLKRFKSPGSDQIPAELIQAGGEILCSKIYLE
jgi:hypothetical protein